MAQRRMFSLRVVGSDQFLDMPATAQNLYWHLGMYADDDGFVNPNKIIRMIGANADDLKVILAKGFAIPFENGVIVIRHWKENNYIQKDRYIPTIYTHEKQKLACIENVYNLDTQVRLELELGKITLPPAGGETFVKQYNEKNHESDYEEEVDVDTGEVIDRAPPPSTTRALIEWAEKRNGRRFPNIAKQSRQIVLMRKAGYSDNDMRLCWERLESDSYWNDKGIDWGVVSGQIGKAVVPQVVRIK